MSSRHGVSLVEVLIAAVILSVCMIPVILFSQRGLTESGHTQQEILGRLLLIDFCERYKACTLNQIEQVAQGLRANLAYLDNDLQLIPRKSIVPRFLKKIARSIDVEKNVNSPGKGLHRVTFTVSYIRAGTAMKEMERTLTLRRLVHEH